MWMWIFKWWRSRGGPKPTVENRSKLNAIKLLAFYLIFTTNLKFMTSLTQLTEQRRKLSANPKYTKCILNVWLNYLCCCCDCVTNSIPLLICISMCLGTFNLEPRLPLLGLYPSILGVLDVVRREKNEHV